jgi:hypothetical protein
VISWTGWPNILARIITGHCTTCYGEEDRCTWLASYYGKLFSTVIPSFSICSSLYFSWILYTDINLFTVCLWKMLCISGQKLHDQTLILYASSKNNTLLLEFLNYTRKPWKYWTIAVKISNPRLTYPLSLLTFATWMSYDKPSTFFSLLQ